VDILINNAGVLAMGTIDDVDIEDLTQMVRVNYEAVVRSSYLFGRAFKAQKSGAIINVSSISAFMTTAASGVYSGTKMAVENLSASLRIELGPHGIRVGSIAPGSTQTEMLDDLRVQIGVPADAPAMQAKDVADAVRFMLERPDRANIAALRIYSAAEAF
jgi:serine 3-dehydrogenase (NADP+)